MRTSSNPVTVVKAGVTTYLDTLAFNIQTKTGIMSMAPLRGSGVVIPGKHGRTYTPGRKRDDNRILLSMWVHASDEDGAVPDTERYAAWRANLDKLMMLFDTEVTTITVREQISAGVFREAVCEVEAAIDPEMLGQLYGKFKVELVIVDTFWSNDVDVEWDSTAGAAIATGGGVSYTMAAFAGSTAPMESLLVLIDGPWVNPRLVDTASGHTLTLPATTLAAGRQWLVNTDTWSSLEGPSTMNYTGTGGSSITSATAGYGLRSPRLFGLTAASAGPAIKLFGTGLSTTSRARIKGRKRYH